MLAGLHRHPIRYGLIMERFLSPLRQALPDIDLDVESARRTEVYEKIFDTFGGELLLLRNCRGCR